MQPLDDQNHDHPAVRFGTTKTAGAEERHPLRLVVDNDGYGDGFSDEDDDGSNMVLIPRQICASHALDVFTWPAPLIQGLESDLTAI